MCNRYMKGENGQRAFALIACARIRPAFSSDVLGPDASRDSGHELRRLLSLETYSKAMATRQGTAFAIWASIHLSREMSLPA